MPLLLILIGLLAPRITLLIAHCAGAFERVWQSLLWPVLGFFFLPYSTLAYGIALAYGGGTRSASSKGWRASITVQSPVV